MGPSRRMQKQGMPQTFEAFHPAQKRKAASVAKSNGPAKKRRHSNEETKAPVKSAKKSATNTTKQPAPVKQVNGKSEKVAPMPLPTDDDSEEEEDVGGLDDDELPDDEFDDLGSEDDGSVTGVPLNEIDEEELDGSDPTDDSVFDSDEEQYPKGQFSDDDDDSDAEAKLTAANIEGLSRRLDMQQAEEEAQAQAELEEAALQTNIAGDKSDVFAGGAQAGIAPDMQVLRNRMTETLRILGDFAKLADPEKSRADYTTLLLGDICAYYGYTPFLAEKLFNLFSPMEAFAFFEANESPRPVVIRTNTLKTNRRSLAQALINRGVQLEPVGKWSKVGLQIFESTVPLGATPEYLAGHYILQAASSFLPVMALAPQEDERVLDMAAAPGGKTTYISALMRNTGCVIANDPNRKRAKGLIGNIHRLGCKNVIVSNLDAKEFPKAMGGFDRVLLDAPCSGTGVIGKDPSVKTSKNERDFLALPHLQKQLLLAAIDSVNHASKTGGYIVYSTCSVSVEENEGVVQYILRKRPNVKIVDTGFGNFGSEGFRSYMNKRFDDKMSLARRYFPHRENVDGFFVCKLKKTGPSPASATNGEKVNGTSRTAIPDDDHDEDSAPITGETGQVPSTADDDFGEFDDEEDRKIIEKSEKNWLRKRGLDPKLASHKTNGKKDGKRQESKSKEDKQQNRQKKQK
ncbi:putative s-adenosylmethionine-dependent methyltransferase superfamily domain-containing protein [Phaeomoniella chlamydospora]|uniref:Nucleolar protein 2 n=1 Tax=Phaeomoniella chlamydospora TaxID=158046 RepID=A0A0G2FVI6_PHACM|nr:putative s-adenosylmethionine-dependent methyltransferase superfamily domain-containing protein [Phaeomoniella chlamydospora]